MINLPLIVYCLLIIIQFNKVIGDNSVDPDTNRDIVELITSRGFDYEVHYVTTEDNYILGVYRIVNPFVDQAKRKQLRPIVIQHGFISSGETFLINSPDGFAVPCDPDDQFLDQLTDDDNNTRTNNLGFLLSNRCYDVWLANSRGNQYSRNHTTLDPDKDKEFWNFSFDQMIQYDTPNLIDYILELTGRENLGWIGHSQGTLIMFGLLSERPNYSLKVKPFIALAPVVYVGNILPALRIAAALPFVLYSLRKTGGELGDGSSILSITSEFVCNRWEPIVCENLIYPLKGYSPDLLNTTRLDVYRAHLFSGSTSVWDLVHFGQNVNKKTFIKFDYGTAENRIHYNGPTPPKYKVSQINSTQLALFHSKADTLGDVKDVATLIKDLKVPLFRDYEIAIPTWDHQDFIYADNLYEVVHVVILDVLRQSQLLELNLTDSNKKIKSI
ncbi:gastric triacylglycerol lipase-like [Panonychus citri]|uniref:gastric triacylglycerol lipase-like n=1 Tax=Panonychus citri TaxID=50023 RepID=UPI002307C0E7|nr:gastric triacylglycerol lipase-like [Panonychus citri]